MRERQIGPFVFPTKKQAEQEIRRILHETPLETPLEGDERELILGLTACHPDAAEKIGPGVERIEVRIIEYSCRGFWLHRVDGTVRDFSYKRALDGALSPEQAVKAALRWEVQDQIDAYRTWVFTTESDAEGYIICPLTGQKLSSETSTHVDHVKPTFVEMAARFIEVIPGGASAIAIENAVIGARSRLQDRGLAEVWRAYHQQIARLRVVHASANLARHRRGVA